MKAREAALTPWQVQTCAEEIPAVIRAAFFGQEPDSRLSLTGVTPEELCLPLSAETLARIRSCTSVKWQNVDVIPVPDEAAEARGVLLFRVNYEFEGYDSDGTLISVEEEGDIAVHCLTAEGRGRLSVEAVEACAVGRNGRVKPPPKRRKATPAASPDMGGAAEEAAGCCLEAVIEIVLEFIADG